METRNFFGLQVPPWAALTLIVVLPVVGFLIGSIGGYRGGTTITVNATVTPQDIGLNPGETRPVAVVVPNPKKYGLRVSSIAPSRSEAVEGSCPEGLLTSEQINAPSGYLAPEGSNAYTIPVTMAQNASEQCQGQAFTLPLTVEAARR